MCCGSKHSAVSGCELTIWGSAVLATAGQLCAWRKTAVAKMVRKAEMDGDHFICYSSKVLYLLSRESSVHTKVLG